VLANTILSFLNGNGCGYNSVNCHRPDGIYIEHWGKAKGSGGHRSLSRSQHKTNV
jgi:hypothetical protein